MVVVCAAIQDPENLGGILRNCAAFGVDLVVIGENSADPLSRRVLRVSMGTVLKLRFYQSTQLEQDVWRLRDEFSIHLAASVAEPGAPVLDQAPRPRSLGFVAGQRASRVESGSGRRQSVAVDDSHAIADRFAERGCCLRDFSLSFQ